MLIKNKHAKRVVYSDDLKLILNIHKAEQSKKWLSTWPLLGRETTPLWELSNVAKKLEIGRISVKDESKRSRLASFKALGAPIALVRLILREKTASEFTPQGLFTGQHKSRLDGFTVISATDGNHGLALAAAAKDVGCQCVIVLHRNVSEEREKAIAAYGAKIVRIDGNYDASVQIAAELATKNRWYVVSDTSYDGYEEIPRDVMQGYGAIVSEILAQEEIDGGDTFPYTHIFLQGGVGGLAAGIVSYLWEYFGEKRPIFIVVEPKQADCLQQSAILGQPARATGSVDSIMAGLACGETSPLAWRFLEKTVDYFQTIDDLDAEYAMRYLASGADGDIPMVCGESGVAGFAGLLGLLRVPELRELVALDRNSSVLLINTEGATAPKIFEKIVGKSAEKVLENQAVHLADMERIL
jgi:diaminopropionate ammonia-lyase